VDAHRFDALTRLLAGTTSRRSAIRLLVATAGGGVLAVLGVASARDKEPEKPVPPTDVCPTPSSPGNRQSCAADLTCICIRSAEGINRCGRPPGASDVVLCQTSADCAKLGVGYFCDTPGSGASADLGGSYADPGGSSTDPGGSYAGSPTEKPRCIAPCDATAAQVLSACPPERVCGALCCPEEHLCCNGACSPGSATGPCAADPVTIETLEAARSALAAGAISVKLSSQGCARYERTVVGGMVTAERILMEDRPALAWAHTDAESTGQRDADLDGVFEWRATVQRGATERDAHTEITDYMPASTAVASRVTYARADDIVHVRREQADAGGILRTVSEFDAGLEVGAPADRGRAGTTQPLPGRAAAAGMAISACAPDQEPHLRERLRHAIDVGLECMRHNEAFYIWLDVLSHYAGRDVLFDCRPGLPNDLCAAVSTRSIYDPGGPIRIGISEDCFFDLSDYEQSSLLWHEMLHLNLGPHDPQAPDYGRFQSIDRVEACEVLCFGPGNPSQCSCATCLGTNVCDPRCSIYSDCDPNLQYLCPCPAGPKEGMDKKWFATCSECLAACPSGLACSGFHTCDVGVSVACGSPGTCR
jgi:hypothetical protein